MTIDDITGKICSLYPQTDEREYKKQLDMIYGILFVKKFITSDMEKEILEIEQRRMANVNGSTGTVMNPKMLISEYSKIAFILAQMSLDENKSFLIASVLDKVFDGLISSKAVTESEKKELKKIISETILDFKYAAGKHDISSLRMASIIRNKN